MKEQKAYGNESISSLKGADRVRLRPAVIFGSDGLEGCEHAVFEILSNAIAEAREGYGRQILVTRYEIIPLRSRTSGAAVRSTGTKKRENTTGSLSSASFTQAVSTRTTRAAIMNFRWA